MQKVLRRTAKAEAQYALRTRRQRSKEIVDDRWVQIIRQKIAHGDVRALRLAAIKARHEDWELGPLAPRRDIGSKKDTYGAVPFRVIERVDKPEGTWKDWGIRQGDRVVVVGKKERDRGRIGTVTEVSQKSETVTVEGINTVNLRPSFSILHVPRFVPFISWCILISRLYIYLGQNSDPFFPHSRRPDRPPHPRHPRSAPFILRAPRVSPPNARG